MASKLNLTRKNVEETSAGFVIKKGDTLISNHNHYYVLDFVGGGNFGKVAKCIKMFSKQIVALKIFKTKDDYAALKREIKMLKVVSILDPRKTHLVKFFEHFRYKGLICLAFEMLDRNLEQLVTDRYDNPLSVSEIRPITHQLLSALEALGRLGVIYASLTPSNIMLVNHKNQPFRVKLTGFDLSLMTSEVKPGMKFQPVGYRAPEVSLGLHIGPAVDMWSLGCVLSFLYLRNHLFDVSCEYEEMNNIVEVLGQPADHLLSAGHLSSTFFKRNQPGQSPQWRLKTPIEYQLLTGIRPTETWNTVSSLDELVTLYPKIQDPFEMVDRRAFVNLLKCLFQMDPEQRIKPADAFNLQFLSMIHLTNGINSSIYVDRSIEKTIDCLTSEEDEDDDDEECEKAKGEEDETDDSEEVEDDDEKDKEDEDEEYEEVKEYEVESEEDGEDEREEDKSEKGEDDDEEDEEDEKYEGVEGEEYEKVEGEEDGEDEKKEDKEDKSEKGEDDDENDEEHEGVEAEEYEETEGEKDEAEEYEEDKGEENEEDEREDNKEDKSEKGEDDDEKDEEDEKYEGDEAEEIESEEDEKVEDEEDEAEEYEEVESEEDEKVEDEEDEAEEYEEVEDEGDEEEEGNNDEEDDFTAPWSNKRKSNSPQGAAAAESVSPGPAEEMLVPDDRPHEEGGPVKPKNSKPKQIHKFFRTTILKLGWGAAKKNSSKLIKLWRII